MSTLKLTYFAIKGRAEPIRLAFHIGGIAFEDHRIGHEEWPALKPTLPFQQLPVLSIDGKIVAQSNGLLRFAGSLGKLYPVDPFQAALVDQIIFQIQDIKDLLIPTFKESDEAKRIALREKIAKENWPKQLEGLEKVLTTYGGRYAVGDTLTIADIVIYIVVGDMKSGKYDGVPKNVLDPFAKLNRFYKNVLEHPKVVAWEESHKV